MNKRQSKKAYRECTKHGYYAWINENSRKANEVDKNNCLRNNYRKRHKMPLIRKCK